jgi:hypothetical protein
MRRSMKTLSVLGALALPLSVMAGGKGNANMGFEYGTGFSNNDNGYEKTETNTPDASQGFGLWSAKWTASHEFGNGNHVNFLYDLNNSKVDKAYVHRMLTSDVSLKVGKMRTNQSGWNGRADNYDAFASNVLTKKGLHGKYADALALDYKLLNFVLTVQMLNDVKKADGNKYKNDKDGFAPNIQWEGTFAGGVKGLVQLNWSDAMNSMAWTAGAHFTHQQFSGYVDYTTNTRKEFTGDKEKDKTQSGLNLEVHYDMGNMKPFVAYNSFSTDAKNDSDKAIETNTTAAPAIGNAPAKVNDIDNNEAVISFGVEMAEHSSSFRPRLTIASKSANFAKSATEKESRSQLEIKLGIYGNL